MHPFVSGPFPQQYICDIHPDDPISFNDPISFIHCCKSTRGERGPEEPLGKAEDGGGGLQPEQFVFLFCLENI